MALRLDGAPEWYAGQRLTTEDRLEAVAWALAECRNAGEVLAVEQDYCTPFSRVQRRPRSPRFVHEALKLCDARREELSREAAQASGGATADFWKWE